MTRTPYTFLVNGRPFNYRSWELPTGVPSDKWLFNLDKRGKRRRRREPQSDPLRYDEGGGESWTEAMSIICELNDAFYAVVDEYTQAKLNVLARASTRVRTTARHNARIYRTVFNDVDEG